MILSVVIVSYNVKFFLEQCLSSLKKAVEGSSVLSGETEVFIVDNASADGSYDFLEPLYPSFHFIRNKENTGFAKANNQALAFCKGQFVLFLNPDTILAEDSADICISFFRQIPDAGALGVRMIDGAGHFLKESKRGFPSPIASFFKMSGLIRVFPRSKIISAYYLGHLDEKQTHAVDILSGAFMMVRKILLDQTAGFDEQFFMYAEDIDLSYRLSKTGFRNYYLPQTTIIHFKGESTKKDFRYIKMFYTAMELFMKKHFQGPPSSMQLLSLRIGVRMHQALSALRLPVKKSNLKPAVPLRVFIQGEPAIRDQWKQKLIDKKIPVADTEMLAEEIIYCEGPPLSWKSIIWEMENKKRRFVFKFHGQGTHAAVGSYSSRELGEVFEI